MGLRYHLYWRMAMNKKYYYGIMVLFLVVLAAGMLKLPDVYYHWYDKERKIKVEQFDKREQNTLEQKLLVLHSSNRVFNSTQDIESKEKKVKLYNMLKQEIMKISTLSECKGIQLILGNGHTETMEYGIFQHQMMSDTMYSELIPVSVWSVELYCKDYTIRVLMDDETYKIYSLYYSIGENGDEELVSMDINKLMDEMCRYWEIEYEFTRQDKNTVNVKLGDNIYQYGIGRDNSSIQLN